MHSARFRFREMPKEEEPPVEHRGSRMPEGMTPIDPLFADAAFRKFEPETPEQAEALREKAAHGRRSA
jgi:hypothetical protein